jgi:hypothetical protein
MDAMSYLRIEETVDAFLEALRAALSAQRVRVGGLMRLNRNRFARVALGQYLTLLGCERISSQACAA